MNMTRMGISVSLLLLASSLGYAGPEHAPREVSFRAADGLTVYADLYMPNKASETALIILFHQAGADTRGEYGTHIPRLLHHGYNVLSVDQRSGGNRFGGVNRTVQAAERQDYGYCEAYPDLVATLKYADDQSIPGPRFVWGSSYSAALVFRLAAAHGDAIAGVLSFSTAAGGPMADCRAEPVLDQVNVPAIAFRPRSEMKNASTQNQFKLFAQYGMASHIVENGVHGSSMLNPDRVEGSVDPAWQRVFGFIDEVVAQR